MFRFAATLCVTVAICSAAEPIDFDRQIRPILSENCFLCHGQDAAKRMAGLRLDSFAEATKDRGGHAALVPGDPQASELVARITADDSARRMPPVYSNRELTAEQIKLLERWVAQGGQYAVHWAFAAAAASRASQGFRPRLGQAADRRLRAGAPGRGEAAAFASKPRRAPGCGAFRSISPDCRPRSTSCATFEAAAAQGEPAYEAAVDRLLASPRYGERMAMDWLDVARYADTHGFNNDSSRSMWRWRDWVIDAFNGDMPYDRFITEQLAGDLLPSPTLDQRIATGFNRNHVINSEGGIIEEEYRVEYVADRVRTVSMAWMGLSFECARCHDHKFDPITQRDYYRLFAFFNSVPEAGEAGRVANATPMIPAPTREQQARAADLAGRIRALEQALATSEAVPLPSGAKLRKAAKRARKAAPAMKPQWALSCDDGAAAGVAGMACSASAAAPLPEITAEKIKLAKDAGFTLSLWLEPTRIQGDQPLFSAVDYSPDPAASIHGQGVELRLAGPEIELRMNKRSPAYSITVRSRGAAIEPGRWAHVAAVYEGPRGDPAMRAKAAWVRLYVDGKEVETRTLYDDLQFPLPEFEQPFRLGWNNERSKPRFEGLLDEATLWLEPLTGDQVAAQFRSQAIPYAAARIKAGDASEDEIAWVRALNPDPRHEELESLRAELYELERNEPTVMVMQEMDEPRETHLLQRGTYNMPGETVEPGVPEDLLGPWPEGAPHNRLGLARWLTSAKNPLTARVVVNRFWQQLFGVGLVKTSENFGLQGDSPSHPELLDWLAREFVASGWDVKALLRGIVLSAAYRQDSGVTPELEERDPENRLLARGPRFRLPAEVIRDQALALAGLLQNRTGGPSVHPYQPKGLYDGVVVGADYPGTKWIESEGADLYRRSLYTFWKRTLPHPTMTVFDAPDREFCVVRRSTTNTPLQALTLLNDPIFVEAARKLAERVLSEGGADDDARLAYLFELATGRRAQPDEIRLLRQSLDELSASYAGDERGAEAALEVGASAVDAGASPKQLAAYTAVASMVLNLDEVITKG